MTAHTDVTIIQVVRKSLKGWDTILFLSLQKTYTPSKSHETLDFWMPKEEKITIQKGSLNKEEITYEDWSSVE